MAAPFPRPPTTAKSLSVLQVGEEGDSPVHVPKSQLARIIGPRVEEILELTRDRLKAAGFATSSGSRIVLSGGSSQLTGLPEAARRILGGQVRIGRPLGVQGLPESAKNPGFAAAIGLLIYPQFASDEHFEPGRAGHGQAAPSKTYIGRVGQMAEGQFLTK